MGIFSKYEKVWSYLLIISMTVSSFLSAITFVQIGLPLLGTEVLGLSSNFVSLVVLGFAFAGAAGALIGILILKRVIDNLTGKIVYALIFNISTIFIITLISRLNTSVDYSLWMLLLGFIGGIGSINSYSLLYDLIPHGYRGRVGGIIVALIYGIGPFIVPSERTFENYLKGSSIRSVFQLISFVMLIFFILARPVSKKVVDKNHGSSAHYKYPFKEVLITLLVILFVDSFGFIRAINTPFVENTWEGRLEIRIFIAVSHIISALICGYIYDKKSPRLLLKISLVCFIIGDVLFALMFETSMEGLLVYLFPLVYAPAVSIYTLSFLMLWADISTPKTEAKIYGIGIAITGWLGSFISTSFALGLVGIISPQLHLGLTAIIALGGLVYMLKLPKYGKQLSDENLVDNEKLVD